MEVFNKFPYGVLVNPYWEKTWGCYSDSLESLLRFTSKYESSSLSTANGELIDFKLPIESNDDFVKVLMDILSCHHDNLMDTNSGIRETNFDQNGEFLNDHLRERILLQLICNNHIALSENGTGIINEKLNVIESLQKSITFVSDMALLKYGEVPKFKINSIISSPDEYKTMDGDNQEIIFPYIDSHIQYVLQELLKNSTRATIENNITEPINILVTLLTKGDTKPVLQIKISDKGMGISPKILDHLWNYSFTTVENNGNIDDGVLNSNIIAGMGYGLPLSLIYCKLFGGDIRLKSIHQNGTDVYCQFMGF